MNGTGALSRARSLSARLVRTGRNRLRSRFGIWVLFETRNRVLGWPSALLGRSWEAAEVRRLRGVVDIPRAEVTTIVATYRRPQEVQRAVRSALAQDLESNVVVVIDDGGGLPPLPEDDRVVGMSLSRNTGRPGIVRNVGVRLARSQYVAFLDDDNEWYPQHLSTTVAALRDVPGLVYTAVERVLPDGSPVDVLSTPFDRRTLADEAYVDTNSIVTTRARGVRFSRLRRTRHTLPGEDWELVWRLSRRLVTRHLPVATVRYVVNPASYFTRWE